MPIDPGFPSYRAATRLGTLKWRGDGFPANRFGGGGGHGTIRTESEEGFATKGPCPMAAADAIRTYDGAVAFVTGGASGIGLALANALVKRGAEVVLADRQVDRARAAEAAIRAVGGRATAVELDVTDAAAFEQAVRATAERCGRLDFLFNNAGIGVGGEVSRHTLDSWNAIIDVNLRGVVHGIHSAYPVFIRQGYGHIINTASIAGFLITPYTTAYAATKSAVVAMSRALRVEAAPHGVRVSALCPGVIRTPILEGGKYGHLIDPIPRETALRLWERLRPMEPAPFADRVLDAVRRNPAVIIIPRWWRLVCWIARLSGGLELFVAARLYRRLKQELDRP